MENLILIIFASTVVVSMIIGFIIMLTNKQSSSKL